jgi:FG-GAP-like repeat/Cadherin-like beta sandwich domain
VIRSVLLLTLLGGCAQLIGVEDAGELRLANLEVSTGTLVPAFDAEVTSYTVALPYVGPSLAVTASADESVVLTVDGVAATVDVPQTFDVPVGDMSIAVSLRATSGVERTYTVAVHRADLDLAFGAPQPVFGLTTMYAVQRADVNGDGVDDLLCTGTDGSVGTFVNGGTGVFTSTSTAYLPGLNPRALAVVDVSGDGIGDLIVANGSLMIATGKGDGSFETPADFGAFSDASTFSVGRVDADALDDLVVANGTGLVTPVFGHTTGPTKGADWSITQIVGEPRIVRLAKIDGPKLVALDSTDHVIIVVSTSDPTMRWPFQLDSLAYPSDMLVADFDGDARDDIAFLDQVTGTVTVLTKFPNWERTSITVDGNPRALAIGDLDNDGHVDLAMTAGNDLVVLRNDGTAHFEQRRFANMVDTPSGLAIGDFNHDGRDDVIFAQGTSLMMMAFGEHRE